MEENTLRSKRLDHLGLVSGICEELGIAETVDRLIPNVYPDKIVSTGTGVVAMILNGLGFVNKSLYMFPGFFEGKPLDKLLGVSYLEASHLNDDALGRCLDALDEYGVNELFSLLSQQTVSYLSKTYGLEVSGGQMDNSTFSHYGPEKKILDESGEVVFEICPGYSKENRPDLVQIGLQLIVDSKSRIPLLMQPLSGNCEESKSYGETIQAHVSQLQKQYPDLVLIGDSKVYTAENLGYLATCEGLQWISRVPASLMEVKELKSQVKKSDFQVLASDPSYRFLELGNSYGGVRQKWFLFFSEALQESQVRQFDKKYQKALAQEEKAFQKLTRQKFSCLADGQAALEKFAKTLTYSQINNIAWSAQAQYGKRGKPSKTEQATNTIYRLDAQIQADKTVYAQKKEELGFFILASNQLDAQAAQVLARYKEQDVTEKSFRFLKDPNLVASSFYVQKPQRIRALLFIMTLCLLVYAALEYKIRTELEKQQQTFDNQLGKKVKNPTLRWVFQCFEGIELLYEKEQFKCVLNLKPPQKLILNLLGANYWHFYS